MMDVRIGGVLVASFAHVSDVVWADRLGDGPCGPASASFTVAVDPSNDFSLLRVGRTVEVSDHGVKVFGGRLSEMARDFPRPIHARGWATFVEGESTVVGTKYGRTADNVAFTPVADATFSWLLDAGSLDIGVADDGLFTRVVATYVSSINGSGVEIYSTVTVNDATAQTLYGVVTYEMDQTSLGVQSGGDASTLATAQLAEFSVPQLLSRVVATSQILLSPGGHPAFLPNLRSGQVVKMFNVPNSLGVAQSGLDHQFVIGETEHSQDNPAQVTIAPQRLVVRNLLDALTEAARAAKAAA